MAGKEVDLDTPFRIFAGIDWATEEHTMSILDANRNELENKAYPHSGAGLNQLADRLAALSNGDPSTVAVGIETPHGAVVETLVERGFAVFSLNPKQMDRFRDRHCVSGAKDDRRDAYVIADAVATDMKKFHRVKLSGPPIDPSPRALPQHRRHQTEPKPGRQSTPRPAQSLLPANARLMHGSQ